MSTHFPSYPQVEVPVNHHDKSAFARRIPPRTRSMSIAEVKVVEALTIE